MSEDNTFKPQGLAPLLAAFQAAASPQAMEPVEVVEPAMIYGDVELADGTVLRLRVIVSHVSKLLVLKGPGGRPMYSVEAHVVPAVKSWK